MTRYDKYLSVSFKTMDHPTALEGQQMPSVTLDNFSEDVYFYALDAAQQEYPGAQIGFGEDRTLDIITENGVVANVSVELGIERGDADRRLYGTSMTLGDLQKCDWEDMEDIEAMARGQEAAMAGHQANPETGIARDADFTAAVESIGSDEKRSQPVR